MSYSLDDKLTALASRDVSASLDGLEDSVWIAVQARRAAAGAGTSAMGGAAPVGPVGAGGGHSGSATRPGLAAPAVLTRAADDEGPYQGFDDEDEW